MPWYPWDLWSYATVCGDVPSTPSASDLAMKEAFDELEQRLEKRRAR